MSLNGIDISNHQAGIDLTKVSADFVICKATEGVGFVDPYCNKFIQTAKRLGRKTGVYHYASGKSTGKAEADFFYKNIQGYVKQSILVLDWEGKAIEKGPQYAKEFLDRLYELTGVRPLIYMSNSVVNSYDWTKVVQADYGLWNAGYFAGDKTMDYTPDAPLYGGLGTWKTCALYQYTSSGRLEGWGGNLDLNVFYGTRDTWDKYAGAVTVVNDPDGAIKPGGEVQEDKAKKGKVSYQVHVRRLGWLSWKCDGEMAGTTRQNRRMEAIRIAPPGKTNVKLHIKGIGDRQYKDITKNTILGTTGEKRRIEAIAIEAGEEPEKAHYAYQVHQKRNGWTDWKFDGEWAGKQGEALQLEALRIRIAHLVLEAHVQREGWLPKVPDGEITGTIGKSLRLEAFRLDPFAYQIKAKAHIQSDGWVDYGVINKDTVIGTTNEKKRLECLCFEGPFEWRAHLAHSGWTDWTLADGIATLGTVGQELAIEAFQIRMNE